jgi:hypothetical protein
MVSAAASRLWLSLATATVMGAAVAEEAGPASGPFKLELAKPVELSCLTKSVVVRTNEANATTGDLKLALVLKEATTSPAKGAWRIAFVSDHHAGSLGKREAKACAEACPLTVAADGDIQLWSPAPKGLEQLAANERLLLAVVKTKSLDLRATTFSGKDIDSLEEGTCRTGP